LHPCPNPGRQADNLFLEPLPGSLIPFEKALAEFQWEIENMANKMDKNSNALPAEPPDQTFMIRCPRLGHQINFSYCRSENMGLPCFKTLDCWFTYFDVHAHLKSRLTEADFQRVFQTPGKPKIFSLMDLIEQAQKNKP
jgi:hypothetical protein